MTHLVTRALALLRTLFAPRSRHRVGQLLPPPHPYADDIPVDFRPLWLAMYGIDISPRCVPGREAAQ